MAQSALEYALQADFPEIQAEALLACAHVKRLAGAPAEADSLVEQAVALFELRGDVNSVAQLRR